MRDLPNIFYFVKVHHCFISLSSIFVITFITQSCCATVISWKLGRLIALPGMLHASIFSGCDSNIDGLDLGWKKTRASIFSAVKAACNFSRVMFVSESSTTDGITRQHRQIKWLDRYQRWSCPTDNCFHDTYISLCGLGLRRDDCLFSFSKKAGSFF